MNIEQKSQLNPKEFCRDCHKFATWQECSNCYKPICDECSVKCAECGAGDVRCVSCAIKAGFEERAGLWYCENCPVPELEHECNDCGIMIPTSRPICTPCEKWYEERGLPLPKALPENVLTGEGVIL